MTGRHDGNPPGSCSDAVTAIKTRADRIYSRVPDGFKRKHHGEFMAVVVTADEYFTATDARNAIERARAAHPHGLIHLIRIGHDAAFSHR